MRERSWNLLYILIVHPCDAHNYFACGSHHKQKKGRHMVFGTQKSCDALNSNFDSPSNTCSNYCSKNQVTPLIIFKLFTAVTPLIICDTCSKEKQNSTSRSWRNQLGPILENLVTPLIIWARRGGVRGCFESRTLMLCYVKIKIENQNWKSKLKIKIENQNCKS